MKRGAALLLAFIAIAAAWAACSVREPDGRGQYCEQFFPCPEPYLCVNNSCATRCSFPGDCDPGYLCLNEVCLRSCESGADCPDNLPCSASGLQGASYCGTSVDPVCGTTEDCPVGYACLGSRCRETCSRDAMCAPREACFDRGGFGQCLRGDRPGDFDAPVMDAGTDAAIPNNVPTNRDCRGKEADYCSVTFGEEEVCFDGRCRIAPTVLVIIDDSSGESCTLTGGEPDAAGVDIIGVENGSENPDWASVSALEVADGGWDGGLPSLANTRSCTAAPVSLGCGGWMAVTAQLPLLEGTRITVFENGDTCDAPVLERYQVRICTDERAVTLNRDLTSCTLFVGEGTGERRFTISY